MFQKVLRYTGRHRKTTYASILVLVAGVAMSVLPYFFLYRLLRPLLTGGSLTLEETLFNAGAMALCMVLYGLLYVEGLALSHRSAYHTLENLRLHLQSKLEKQPLGAIQELSLIHICAGLSDQRPGFSPALREEAGDPAA